MLQKQITKNYHIGIKAVILNKNKVLVVENITTKNNRYSLPGGKIDVGESIEQALKRELKEELGINKVKIGSLIHAFERLDYKNNIGLMLLVYKVSVKAAKIKLSDEHIGYKWIDKKEFLKLTKNKKNFHPGIVKTLNIVL